MLCEDAELRRLARLPSWEYDAHTENVKLIGLDDPKYNLDKKRARHVGKITSHGAQRDMHGKRLSDSIFKELDVVISPTVCDEFLTKYHAKHAAIRGHYFPWVRKEVMRSKTLTNSWGRRIDFKYDRLGDDLFRQAYSFLPQSEVADLMNQWGVLPMWQWMRHRYNRPPNVQVHDSILVSVPPEDAYDAAVFLKQSLEQPLMLNGHALTIFAEFKLGRTWAGDVEVKQLPSREAFTHLACQVAAGDLPT